MAAATQLGIGGLTGENAPQLGRPQVSDGSFDFDVIVIGAGYGGFDAAKHAAEHGLRTAIIERNDFPPEIATWEVSLPAPPSRVVTFCTDRHVFL